MPWALVALVAAFSALAATAVSDGHHTHGHEHGIHQHPESAR